MSFAWTIVALVVVLAIAWRFLGSHLVSVFEGRVRWLAWVERPIYRQATYHDRSLDLTPRELDFLAYRAAGRAARRARVSHVPNGRPVLACEECALA